MSLVRCVFSVGFVCSLFYLAQPAAAIDTTWTFDGDGLWTNAGNWDNGEPDNSAFHAIIDDGDTDVTVTLDVSRTIGNLTVSNFDTLLLDATSTVVQLFVDGSFTNDGSLLMTSSNSSTYPVLQLGNGGTLTNSATGLLHFQADQGDRYFTGNLVNNGTVQVDHNTYLNESGDSYTNNAQFNVASSAVFNVQNGGVFNQDAGTFDLNGELELGGSTFNVNGGTFDFDAAALIDNGTFNYVGGMIVGTPKLRNVILSIAPTATNPATFLMNDSNTLSSDLGAGHTIRMEAGASTVVLYSASSFTNDGSILMTSNSANYTELSVAGSTLTNSATGLLHFQADQGYRYFRGDLINNGTVQVDHNTDFYHPGGTYANNADFNVASGVEFKVSNAGTFNQDAGTFDLNGELELGGSTFNVNGGTFDFDAAALIDNGTFNYVGGMIVGTPKLRNVILSIAPTATNPATFLMNDSNTLSSDLGAGHTIRMEAGASTVVLYSASSFTNDGSILMTSNSANYTELSVAGSTLTNSATGLLHFQADQGYRYFRGDLINDGTVQVDHYTEFYNPGGTYTNNGQLVVAGGGALKITNAGTLTNYSGITLTGGTFDLAGILELPSVDIRTNQAQLILRGPGPHIQSAIGFTDALSLFDTNGASGTLKLIDGGDVNTLAHDVTNDGVIELDDSALTFALFGFGVPTFTNSSTGQIRGNGTIQSAGSMFAGAFTNDGLIAPGTSPGILNIGVGAFTQSATGTLAIEIGGNDNSDPMNAEFDVLQISGDANLSGLLTLALWDGFTPAASDVFTILDATTLSGAFDNVANGQRLETQFAEGSFVVSYVGATGNVVLSNFVPIVAGDYNRNGIVDAADYTVWRNTLGQMGSGLLADGDHDFQVDEDDYGVWKMHFGESLMEEGAGGIAVSMQAPEPATALLLSVAALIVLLVPHPKRSSGSTATSQ